MKLTAKIELLPTEEQAMRLCRVCHTPLDKYEETYCSRKCIVIGRRTGQEVECPICGKVHYLSLSRVALGGRYCSKQCYWIAKKGTEPTNKDRVKRKCLVCQAEFETSRSTSKKYCSPECFHKVHKEYMKEFPSVPRNRITKTCAFCGNTYQIVLSWADTSRFCSRKCLYAHSKTIRGKDHHLYKEPIKLKCEWCQQEYQCKPSLVQRSRFCSRQCHGAWVSANIHKPTSIEIAIANLLSELNISYEQEKRIGQYPCDFYIADTKLVIECDGDYWHNLPGRAKKDAKKDAWLRKHGYTVLRLPEHKINNDLVWCQEQIIAALKF